MRVPVRSAVVGTAVALLASVVAAAPAGAVDGGLQTTWASSGILALPWSFAPVRNTTEIASSPGGNLFLVGDDGAKGCITRLTTSAALDPGFSAVPGSIGSQCDFAAGANGRFVAVQPTPSGGVVAAALIPDNRLVVRLDSDGSTHFVTEILGDIAADGGQILDVAALSDGSTALLEARDSSGAAWVTIINESGSVTGDWAVPALDPSHPFFARQVLAGPSASLVLVGELGLDSGNITAALRTDIDGNPDLTFSGDGFSDGPPSQSAYPGRGALGADGRVVLAAVIDSDVTVRRLTSSGAVDPTFGPAGAVATLPSGTDGVTDVVPRPDGRIFVAFDGDPSSTAVNVARLTSAGALDTSFSGDGYAVRDTGTDHLRGTTSAALAPGGDLYVFAADATGTDDPEVVLFDGTPAPPAVAMTRPTSTWTLSSSVPLAWTAAGGAGVLNTDVRTRRAPYNALAPAESTALLTETSARSRTVTGVAGGTTLCASTRARDIWAQISEWSVQRCTSVPLTPAQLVAGKGVKAKAAAGTYTGRVLSATKKGATITRTGVKAKRLALVVTTCAGCGKVKVYLGSDLLRTISLKSSSTRKKVVITVASFDWIRTGTLKVKVVSSGKKVLVEGVGVSKV